MRIIRLAKHIAALAATLAAMSMAPRASANSLQDLGQSQPAALAAPHVFLVYWGPEWSAGFTSNNVTSAQYRNYLETFLQALGGSRYMGTQTQYGAGNPYDLYAGQVRLFPTEPPATPGIAAIENVVQLSQQWFGVAQPSAISAQQIFIIALPPGHGDATFAAKGGSACAFHNDTSLTVASEFFQFLGHPISPATYVVLPFQPDSNVCFANSANANSDAFGHGNLDGLSKALAHELGEVLTDPYLGSWRDPDVSGQDETGDKCNTGPMINYGRQTAGVWNYWAVQPLWSNAAGHCDTGIAGRIDNPPDVDFGPTLIGGAIQPKFVDFTNTGDADVVLGAPGATWSVDDRSVSFLVLGGSCPAVIHPGGSCRLGVAFVPQASGPVSAQVSLFAEGTPGAPPLAKVNLSGLGTSVPWLATPSNVRYIGGVPVACADCQNERSVALFNVDSFAHVIAKVALSPSAQAPQFAVVADGCTGQSLAPGQNCSLTLLFRPQSGGPQATVVAVDDDRGAHAQLLFTGDGTGAVAHFDGDSLLGAQLALPHAPLGASPVAKLRLTAQSAARGLSPGAITVDGPFAQSNDCPAFLAAGASCSITVTGFPTRPGAQAGQLNVPHDGIGGPRQIAITGQADVSFAHVSPQQLHFRKTRVGQHSAPLPVGIVPAENGSVRVLSVVATGDFQVRNDCASPIRATCRLSVVFSPRRAGTSHGTLSITTDAMNPIQSVALSGRGVGAGACEGQARGGQSCGNDDDD
ncbi:MAG: choice-of-anchor D domain-containing protein [Burkholderiales bacterium]|nr:choice-of-anchor D domain-containing protein [Burkholderiales bacterium]